MNVLQRVKKIQQVRTSLIKIWFVFEWKEIGVNVKDRCTSKFQSKKIMCVKIDVFRPPCHDISKNCKVVLNDFNTFYLEQAEKGLMIQ